MNQARGVTGRLGSSVKRLAGTLAALFGARALFRGLKSTISAFQVQEQAVADLNAALRATGKFSDEASRAIQRQAAALQEVTRIGDEALISATATLAVLATELDTRALRDAQTAIIGIAETFLRGDIQNAALLIGKSIGSTTNALTRYGIQLDTTGTQQQKMSELLRQSGKFFDVSKEGARTSGGQMTQLKNAMGDLKEIVGGLATKIIFGSTSLLDMKLKFISLQEALLRNAEAIIKWGVTSKTVFIGVGRLSGAVITGLVQQLTTFAVLLSGVFTESAQFARIAMEEFLDANARFRESLRGVIETFGGLSVGIDEALRDLEYLLRTGFNQITTNVVIDAENTLKQGGIQAGQSFIRGIIEGSSSLIGLLESSLRRLLSDVATRSFAGLFPPAATQAALITTGGAAALQRPTSIGPSGVAPIIVNQTINIPIATPDQTTVQQWLQSQRHVLTSIVAEGIRDAPRIAREIRRRG